MGRGSTVGARRTKFAERWARAVTDETYVPMSSDELVRYLAGLADRIVALHQPGDFAPEEARRIGAALEPAVGIGAEEADKAGGREQLALDRGPLGAQALTQALRDVLNPQRDGALQREGQSFASRDKVMQTDNDYEKEVFNGDIGFAFRLTFLNKCDEVERSTLAEYYQRCFGKELPASSGKGGKLH